MLLLVKTFVLVPVESFGFVLVPVESFGIGGELKCTWQLPTKEHNVCGAWTGRTGQLFQSLSRQPETAVATHPWKTVKKSGH